MLKVVTNYRFRPVTKTSELIFHNWFQTTFFYFLFCAFIKFNVYYDYFQLEFSNLNCFEVPQRGDCPGRPTRQP